MSDKQLARTAGVFYLIIIICGLFSEGFVRMSLIVPGQAVQTATNIAGADFLFRLGFVSDLVMIVADIIVAVIFYFLLRPVSEIVALLAAFFRLAQAAVIAANLLNHLSPLLLVSTIGDGSFDQNQLSSLTLFFMEGHRHGYLISQVLFSINCIAMGYLLIQSRLFPKILGWGVSMAAVVYLLDALVNFLSPNLAESTALLMVIPILAEFSLCFWLLFKGIKTPQKVSIA